MKRPSLETLFRVVSGLVIAAAVIGLGRVLYSAMSEQTLDGWLH